jgi:hypothetical protein
MRFCAQDIAAFEDAEFDAIEWVNGALAGR